QDRAFPHPCAGVPPMELEQPRLIRLSLSRHDPLFPERSDATAGSCRKSPIMTAQHEPTSSAAKSSLQVCPRPWDYNPSAWSQRIPISVLAMVAFFIATYMGLYQWRLIDSAWDPVFGDQTQKVLDSDVSEKMR